MKIIGAGMAGLIAANYFRKKSPIVLERQSGLPHNHAALLRFKTDVVSRSVGIPFKKVLVNKAVVHGHNYLERSNPYVCNQYSLKVTGKIMDRSIWNLDSDYRYIAPLDFIEQLARDVAIQCNFSWAPEPSDEPVVSTVPMPIMMKAIGWKSESEFKKRTIWALTCELTGIEVDVYQTIYFSDLNQPYYRASIVGNQLIAELISDPFEENAEELAEEILDFFGIPVGICKFKNLEIKEQEYGKIVPINDDERKEFMYMLTRDYNIYSLGRFATWRQILLDDLIKDLGIIENLIVAEGKRRLYVQRLSSVQ